jgi:hypothetical protein
MTENSENGGAASEAAPQTDNDGFLTKEQLQDRARFNFRESTLELPELGGKVGLRALSVGKRNSLSNQLPELIKDWQLKHTAMSLAAYVSSVEMTVDEWTETIKPWPASGLDRINKEIRNLLNITPEEEASAGIEFRPEDD